MKRQRPMALIAGVVVFFSRRLSRLKQNHRFFSTSAYVRLIASNLTEKVATFTVYLSEQEKNNKKKWDFLVFLSCGDIALPMDCIRLDNEEVNLT